MGNSKNICVVGAGILGLASSLLLTDAGHKVTIVARDHPGDKNTNWASPWAGALLAPYPGGEPEMQKKSLEIYHQIYENERSTGVKETKITEYYDDRDDDTTIWYKSLFADFKSIPKSALPSKAKIGFSYTGFVVNPELFLSWLFDKLKARGVRFIRLNLTSLEQARSLSGAEIVVNASGLGARELASDSAVIGIRGQTMFVKCDYDSAIMFQGSEYTYVIPRAFSGGVIMGGVSQPGSTDKSVQLDLRPDIIRRINQLTNNEFGWVDVNRDVAQDIVGFRPARKSGLRVNREGNTIHAYGAAGLGYMYAFGVAFRVLCLVDERAKL